MSRRGLVLVALLTAGVAAVLVVQAFRHVPTDEEQIRTLFEDAARAAEEKRVGDAVQGVSERFVGDRLDKRGVKQLVAAHVFRGTWVGVTISGIKVEVQGDEARAAVDAVLYRSGKGQPLADLLPAQVSVHRFLCRLAREEGAWRIMTATWRPISLEEAAAGPELSP